MEKRLRLKVAKTFDLNNAGAGLMASRRQFRIYPKQFIQTSGDPAMHGLSEARQEGNGFPSIFNIEADPREEVNVLYNSAWVIGRA